MAFVALTDDGPILGQSYLTSAVSIDQQAPIEVTLLDDDGVAIDVVTGWVVPGLTHSAAAGSLVQLVLPTGTDVAGVALPDGQSVMVSGERAMVEDLAADVDGDRLSLTWNGASDGSFLVEATLDGIDWWLVGSTEEPRLDIDLRDLLLDGSGWRFRV